MNPVDLPVSLLSTRHGSFYSTEAGETLLYLHFHVATVTSLHWFKKSSLDPLFLAEYLTLP